MPEFQKIAADLGSLDKFSTLFDSSAELMTDSLVNNGTIHCVGCNITHPNALQLARLLSFCPDDMRPPLPALATEATSIGRSQFLATAEEKDFAIFLGMPSSATELDLWLDICLEKGLASLLINPDLESISPTDKALELRLEYRSFPDYLTSLVAVSNYLTKSIESQLFGRQA